MLLMVDRIEFGQWLSSEREKRGWSQSDLGRRSGKDRAVINKIESGGAMPAVETFIALAEALDISPITLFQKAGLMPPTPEITPNKRHLFEKIANANDESVQLVLELLEVAVKNQQRQVPAHLEPKTAPK